MSVLYMLVGIPASGKSTWAKEHCTCPIVSRDEVRFEMLKEGEEYFSHENDVFRTFASRIDEHIHKGEDVVADATHLSRGSRAKLLNAIDKKNLDSIVAIWFNISFKVCLERNDKREGREKVPESALKNMANGFIVPIEEEGFTEVWRIDMEEC